MTDEPTPAIRWKNRRRMAWCSLGGIFGFGVAAMIMPDRAERVDTVVISVIGAFLGVVIAYMGGSAVMNWKYGK